MLVTELTDWGGSQPERAFARDHERKDFPEQGRN